MSEAFLAELRDHDERLARRGLCIWLGGEPTFSRKESTAPEWTGSAQGGDKEQRARALLAALRKSLAPHAKVGRAPGRRYGFEPEPRFAYGMRWPRGTTGAGVRPTKPSFDRPVDVPEPGPEEAWLSVTPDPGVVEVNLHPCPDLESFWRAMTACYEAADIAGLSPYRYLFNGRRVDSGGGGQLTFGGPRPEESPFFVHPRLLPGLVRYLNAHPSLSYLFASECVGSASQGPRADEGVSELFEELALTLELLDEDAGPEALQQALGPLLVDASGNSHRAEINVEKLWNPEHPRQGTLGVVEFRALAMPDTAERATAIAALFRALLARLSVAPYLEPLVEWGLMLHDRFALPSLLLADLQAVLTDLHDHELGLGPELTARLQERPEPRATATLAEATLTVSRALEFWPLVGDVASQENRTSRLVDASTECLEILERAPRAGCIRCDGRVIPFVPTPEPDLRVASVRYRVYVPSPGLHPTLPATEPLEIEWFNGGSGRRITLYGWLPRGGAYDGLPGTEAEAARRRAERVVVSEDYRSEAPVSPAPGPRLRVDLRRPVRQ